MSQTTNAKSNNNTIKSLIGILNVEEVLKNDKG